MDERVHARRRIAEAVYQLVGQVVRLFLGADERDAPVDVHALLLRGYIPIRYIRRNGKVCFPLFNWGSDYSDPQTESDPFYQAKGDRGSRYAFLRTGVEDGYITGETADAVLNYMNAIEEATAITEDIDARYDAFANAEASLINNALVVPMGMSVPKYLATRLNYWEGQYASTGFSNKRLKGIHVLDHYVSMAEYEANRDAR